MPIFLVAGHEFVIDRKAIEMKAMGLKPEKAPRRNFTVEAGGKVFPIKQLLANVVDLPPKAFITHEAFKVFTELGYEVEFNR